MANQTQKDDIDRTLSVAPMMAWTDRHCRYFHRLLAPNALLYSEMVTSGAIKYGPKERLLPFSPQEHPVALQLGGYDPQEMALAAKAGEEEGYDEININIGCPSDRVQNNKIGACLMAEPIVVGEAVKAMKQAVSIPVTVKTRIGIDDQDSYDFAHTFVKRVHEISGATTFILHARKAWLSGLSPKENRNKPPLMYDRVYRLKQDFPQCEIIINGGVSTIEEVKEHLSHVDGVMIGRTAYQEPEVLRDINSALFGNTPISSDELMEKMHNYITQHVESGGRVHEITRHMLGLFRGVRGSKRWRQILSNSHQEPSNSGRLMEAYRAVGA